MGQDLTPSDVVIGWKERLHIRGSKDFPVIAKVDSGAKTSSLHVVRYSFLKGLDAKGRTMLRFEVVAREVGHKMEKHWFEAPFVRFAVVRPSTAEPQRRPVVLIQLSVGEYTFETECNLVCRSGMRCRMLLGRSATAGRFLVDTARAFLVSHADKVGPKASPGASQKESKR